MLTNPSKLRNTETFQDDHKGKDNWQFTLIDQWTTNAELRKRDVYWQHHLKTSFQMALMSMKNLVYNKFARQNVFCFINTISVLVFLTCCYHYAYSYYYYHY